MNIFLALLLCVGALIARIIIDETPHPPGRLVRRRMSLEHACAAQSKLTTLTDCPGEICQTFAGQAIAPLLAASDECAQQLMADKIIDAAKDLTNSIKSPDTRKQMIALAIEYRQCEKNTHPIYAHNNLGRNSVYCQEPAKNPELKGLVQKQDPANDPNLFFDHLVTTNASTVVLDSQPNTRPFGEKSGTSKTTPTVPKSTSSDANPSGDPKTTTDATPTVPKSTSGDADPKTTTDTTPTVPKSTSGDVDPKTTTDTTPTVPKSTSGDVDPKTTTDTTPTVPKSTSDNPNPSDSLKSTKSGTGSSTEEGTEDEGGCGGSGDDADNEKKAESSTPPSTLKDTTDNGEKAEDKGTIESQDSLKDATSGGGGKEDKGTVTDSAPTGDGVKAESTTTETNPAPTGNGEKAEDKGTTESQNNLKGVTSGGGGKEDKGTVTDSTTTGGADGVKAESTTTETSPTPTGSGDKAEDKGTGNGEKVEEKDSNTDADEGDCGGGSGEEAEDKGTKTLSTTGAGTSSSPQGSSTTPTSTGDQKPNPSDADPKLKDAGNPPPNLRKQLNATIDLTNVPNKDCHDFRIEFGQGFPGREAKDFAYQPLQPIWSHGAALNMGIIAHSMCDSLHNVCGVKQSEDAATFTPCMDLVNALGKVVKDGSKADLWNLAFNMRTTYRTEMATGPGKGGKGDGKLHPDDLKPPGTKTPSASPPGTTQPPSTAQPQSTPNGNVNQMDMNGNMDQNMQNQQNMQNMQNQQNQQNMQNMQNMNQGNPGQGGK
ncbi:hypothetical protein H4Q26_003013 [Puccinia striiformis f. sp. tritici PST-130]|nr:hypothetical protein H4Q26_003013 [Puccinia striiformis f. sp. tritici PST-130]